jgi:hypothetical protein
MPPARSAARSSGDGRCNATTGTPAGCRTHPGRAPTSRVTGRTGISPASPAFPSITARRPACCRLGRCAKWVPRPPALMGESDRRLDRQPGAPARPTHNVGVRCHLNGVRVTEADIDRIPVGNLRVPRAEVGAVWPARLGCGGRDAAAGGRLPVGLDVNVSTRPGRCWPRCLGWPRPLRPGWRGSSPTRSGMPWRPGSPMWPMSLR